MKEVLYYWIMTVVDDFSIVLVLVMPMCWTGLWLVTFGSCDEEICYLKYLNYL